MEIPIYQIDAFTDERFRGNPAAVCMLNEWLPDKTLQDIAAENNLAETAFVVEKNGNIELRWFTPAVEVDLCGHATLATAYAFKEHLSYEGDEINFKTKSGLLKVVYGGDIMSMIFPRRPAEPYSAPGELAEALRARPSEVLKSRDFLVVFEHEEEVKAIEPDFEKIRSLDCLGVIVTAPGKNADFVSRFFAPQAGINE
ncbi:MAG TPA: PhzF family phenazine biosynthesis protein, partial [Candidatus Kryptobacter bacterium]|nr:PhzF family phenazine biosynthesis protein [Candidatus Kryptobacter bacterium]